MFAALSSRSRKIATRNPRQASRGHGRSCTMEGLEHRVLMSTYSVTNLSDHGSGSFRQAVLNANAHPGADVIDFKVSGTITLTTGEIAVSDSVQIDGPGISALTVSGHDHSRIIDVTKSNINVSISGVTFTGGNPGVAFGGAVLNKGSLALSNDYFYDNVAASYQTGPTTAGGGADIENTGSLNISNCTFDSSTVYIHDTTGLDGGGAIYNAGAAKITHSTFYNNTVGVSSSAPAFATGEGGAIYNTGSLLLTDSTVFDNNVDSAFGVGGGLYASNNSSSTIVDCTFTNNTFFSIAGPSSLKLGNTIVANSGAFAWDFYDVDGPVTSLGNNLIGYSDSLGWLGSDIVGTSTLHPVNPLLGSLANNGGPTKTLALLSGSPARGKGSVALDTHYGITTDQRGDPRTELGATDIGAYETPIIFSFDPAAFE